MLRIAALLFLAVPAAADDWPQFRGPTGDGHYTGPTLPTEWGPDKNVAWKTPIPGKGWSSPIISKGKVYLTTAIPKHGGQSLHVICLDVESGKIDWDKELRLAPASESGPDKIHTKNNHASATPAADDDRVYVHFGHMGTAALDLTGNVVWLRTGLYSKPQHGPGGSPILVDGKLVFSIDAHDKQAVIALSAKTGETAWETPRGGKTRSPFSFGTPTVVTVDGRKQILSEGTDVLAAYDPGTGKELWRTTFKGYSVIPKPVVGGGLVYFSTSFDSAKVLAVRLGGSGDVTSSNVAWSLDKGAPHTASPVLVGERLYVVADRGQFSCINAKTGKVVWDDKLKGNYSASPIVAGGKIYITSEEGKGTLINAGDKKEVLGEFDMNEATFASFAAADGALFVRTDSRLYKFVRR